MADHKMLPDLSHTGTSAHTHSRPCAGTHTHRESLSRVKMLPVNSHLSCVHNFFEVEPKE